MKLIIGLGNPGKEYECTRHNAGFMALEKLRTELDFPEFQLNKKFEAEISEGNFTCHSGIRRLGGYPESALCASENSISSTEKIILAKPQTFMNFSGTAVKKIIDFYKLAPQDMVVIHDDLDIELGKYKLSPNSSSAGHHGVENIIENIGTQELQRIRIGIGKPLEEKLECKISGQDYVLQKFSEEEMKVLENVLEEVVKKLAELCEN